MLESEELIQTTLALAGENLNFSETIIKGIPGHIVYNVQSFDSPYDIDKQDFEFQVSNKDFDSNFFNVGHIFTYLLGARCYSFKITKTINDLTGWLSLSVNLEDVSLVVSGGIFLVSSNNLFLVSTDNRFLASGE